MQLIRSNRSRDLRVDFFRGLALWWIYTDHIPGDVLGDYSLRNFAMCDATRVLTYSKYSYPFFPDDGGSPRVHAIGRVSGGNRRSSSG